MTTGAPTPMAMLSAIVVSWNTSRMTIDCLRSFAADCAGIDYEIIVVDNASSDGSPDAIAEAFPAARVMRNSQNAGFARANNQGIQAARGKYLALINSDVIVLPGCMRALVDYLESRPDVGLISPRILDRERRLQPNCLRFPGYWNRFCESAGLARVFPGVDWLGAKQLSERHHAGTREVDVLTGCFWVARSAAVEQIGGLDEHFFMYGEDIDWCRRFRRGGWRIVYHPVESAIHFGGGSSSMQPTRFFIELQKSTLRYWRKHHGRAGCAYCALMIALHNTLRLIGNGFLYVTKPSLRRESGHKMRRSAACLAWLAGAGGAQ